MSMKNPSGRSFKFSFNSAEEDITATPKFVSIEFQENELAHLTPQKRFKKPQGDEKQSQFYSERKIKKSRTIEVVRTHRLQEKDINSSNGKKIQIPRLEEKSKSARRIVLCSQSRKIISPHFSTPKLVRQRDQTFEEKYKISSQSQLKNVEREQLSYLEMFKNQQMQQKLVKKNDGLVTRKHINSLDSKMRKCFDSPRQALTPRSTRGMPKLNKIVKKFFSHHQQTNIADSVPVTETEAGRKMMKTLYNQPSPAKNQAVTVFRKLELRKNIDISKNLLKSQNRMLKQRLANVSDILNKTNYE